MTSIANFDRVHYRLREFKQFCVWVAKQPYIRDGKTKNSFTSTGWPDRPDNWLTYNEAIETLQKGVKVYHDNGYQPVEGIGFLVRRSDQDNRRPLGGDIDCCRTPTIGNISPWAMERIEKIRPFYTEVSPSGCGLRFFVWGNISDLFNSVMGYGPQDDLSEDDRQEILAAEPDAQKKIEKGDPAFNHLELYQHGRHLTVTGDRIDEYCFPEKDRSKAIINDLQPFF